MLDQIRSNQTTAGGDALGGSVATLSPTGPTGPTQAAHTAPGPWASPIILTHVPVQFISKSCKKALVDLVHPLHIFSGHTHRTSWSTTRRAPPSIETVVPTMSYRMGETRMAVGMLSIHNGAIAYAECQLPGRYTAFARYVLYPVVGLPILALAVWCWQCLRQPESTEYQCAPRSRSKPRPGMLKYT